MDESRESTCVRPFRGATLLVVGALGGLVLWYAAFPSMYYLAWIIAVGGLWAIGFAAPLVHGLAGVAWARLRERDAEISASGWTLLLGWLVVITVAVGLELPLRAHFALARGGLEAQLAQHEAGERRRSRWAGGFFVDEIGPGRCDEERTLLWLENDVESAFVHAPGGIDGLCFNSGHAGHLGGDWYWMTED